MSPETIQAIEKQRPNQPTDDFEVFEDNWQTLLFFLKLGTQWNVLSGMSSSHRLGLNYPAVESLMRLKRIPLAERETLFNSITMMEHAALEYLNSNTKERSS